MKTESKTQLKVGIFLTIGLVVILVSIFMLGADKSLFKKYIHLHAHFDQVQGLSEGSVVSLSGVPIGNVESITFAPDKNALDLSMRVDRNFSHRITKNSQVEIRTQGALGDKFVFIIPGDLSTPAVQEGDVLEVAPSTDFMGIISEKGKDAGRVFDIINEVYKTTRTINEGSRLDKIMTNLSQAASSMNSTAKEAKKLFTDSKLHSSLEHLDSILTKVDRGDGTLGGLINDPSIHTQLKNMLGTPARRNNMKSLIRTSIEKGE